MENLTQRWTQSLKSGQFGFSKKGRGGLPPQFPSFVAVRLPLEKENAHDIL